ncbi:hypothetical protein L6164_025153 [Bauhinia variegata]|uniref:Uncharacterized protein n=1 Tax=Bauhinia variegata TaxID=167791 RepID=A0ACB9M041_BAUVA|nr:hypothetical protein L6164_025153 [Bauhinia variegata]
MAVDSSNEGQPHIREYRDGNDDLPLSCSCIKLLKPSSEQVTQKLPLETQPIIFEDNSLPAGLYQSLHNSHGQDVYSISVLPEDGGSTNCASSLAFLSILEVPNQSKSQMYLDAHLNCENYIDFQMKSEEIYSPCIIDIPSEKDNSISPEFFQEEIEGFKAGNLLTRVLWRQASLKVGGRLMQILMSLSSSRDKSVSEKVLHDMPSNKWRRYKRAASFDSRKVALLFSILSSLGTLVLIYLTLRIRQRGDGFVLI